MDRLAELAEFDRSIPGLIDEDFLGAGFTPEEIASYRGTFTPPTLTPQDIAAAEATYGTLEAPDYTTRETSTQRVQDALINQVGLDPYLAGRYARDIMGDTSPTSRNILDGLGLADLTPLGAVFGIEEGAGTAVEGYEQGDPLKMGLGVAEAGLGVAEAFPLTRPIAEGAGVLAREVYSSPYMADAIGTLRGIRDLDADFLLGRGDPAVAQGVGADVVGGAPAKSIDDQIAELDVEVAALRQTVLDNPTDTAAFDEYKSAQRMRNDLKDQRAVSRAEGRDLSQAVEEPARTATEDEGFEAYLETVNPGGKRVAAEDRPNLMMGDMYGMLPRGSEVIGKRGDTTFFRSSDGNYYATAYNPDLGEQDVVGYIMGRGDGTELQVVDEMKGQGIGGELQYLFRKENPDAPTGGLTEAGEASLRKTYQRLADEGVVDGGVPFGGASAPDIPEAPSAETPNQAGSSIKLYHGTDAPEFDQFDPTQARTARHIYTSSIRDDAAAYGKNVLEFETDANIIDFRPETRGREANRVLRKAFEDGGLEDYFDDFDDFVEAFDSGDMYQRFASQRAQNAVMDELFAASGADGLRIPDAGFGGQMSESVVFENPEKLKRITNQTEEIAPEVNETSGEFFNLPSEPKQVEAPTDERRGIIAFHGSGADFDRFELSKIGTGERAQAFGRGLYFTDSEDIAEFYRQSVRQRQDMSLGREVSYRGKKVADLGDTAAGDVQSLENSAVNRIAANINKVTTVATKDLPQSELAQLAKDKSVSNLQRELDRILQGDQDDPIMEMVAESLQDEIDALEAVDVSEFNMATGKKYQVNIDVSPEELLNWDLPLDQQTPAAQRAILKTVDEIDLDDAIDLGFNVFVKPYDGDEAAAINAAKDKLLNDFSAKNFLQSLSKIRGKGAGEELLAKNGLKGITYKAEQGPTARDPSAGGPNNYVIFDDKLINIMKKYGIVGPVAVTGIAAQEETSNET